MMYKKLRGLHKGKASKEGFSMKSRIDFGSGKGKKSRYEVSGTKKKGAIRVGREKKKRGALDVSRKISGKRKKRLVMRDV